MKFTALLAATCFYFNVASQFSIGGKVVEESNIPVEAVIMRLYKDSVGGKVINSVLSQKNGAFIFKNVFPGRYRITCNGSFYRDTVISAIVVSSNNIELGNFILQPDAKSLQSVQVTGRKKIFDSEAGRRIYNVSADPTVTGVSGVEVINNIPAFRATEEGPVLYRGSAEAVVLVNGRKVPGLPGQYLAQLSSHSIERIEISNNTSEFNAENDAVVVNIILKRAAINEWRAFFSTQAGYPVKQVNSISILHNRKKTEFTFDVGTTLHHHPEKSSYVRSNPNSFRRVEYQYKSETRHLTRKLQTGFVWKPDTTFQYQVSFYGQLWPDKSRGKFDRKVFENEILIDQQTGIDRNVDNYVNRLFEIQQSIHKKFSRKLSASLNLDANRSSDGSLSETQLNPTYTADNYTKGKRTNIRSELVYSPTKDVQVKTGGQLTKNNSHGNASFVEGTQTGSYSIKTDYHVKAAYIISNINLNEQWYLNPSLRYEYFSVDAGINQAAKTTIQTTSGLFPTLIAGYKKGNDDIRFMIRRSIRRPSIFSLIPISSVYNDRFDQAEVNLNVRPAFTYAAELSYARDLQKLGNISINIYGRRSHNEFEEIYLFTTDYNSIRQLTNIGKKKSFGFDMNYSARYLKLCTGSITITSVFDKYDNSQITNMRTRYMSIDVTNSIQLKKGYTLKLRIQHEPRRITVWTHNQAMTIVGFSGSYQFTNKRAALSFDISDIFFNNVTRGYRVIQSGDREYFSSRTDSRVARVGFTYRLGNLNKDVKSNLRGE